MKKYIANGMSSRIPSCRMAPPPPPPESPEASRAMEKSVDITASEPIGEYRREFRHPDERTVDAELWQRCRHDAATCVDRRRRVRRAVRGAGAGRRGCRGDADRPPEPSPVPAAALPGGHGGTEPVEHRRARSAGSSPSSRTPECCSPRWSSVDPDARRVSLDDGAELPYDYLVLATGATHSYFGHDEWEAHAPGLKTIEDALEVRRRVLLAFERAERAADPDDSAGDLTFVVVGGGPTGVETGRCDRRDRVQDVRRASSAPSIPATPRSSCSRAPTGSSATTPSRCRSRRRVNCATSASTSVSA